MLCLTRGVEEKRVTLRHTCAPCRTLWVHASPPDCAIMHTKPLAHLTRKSTEVHGVSSNAGVPKICRASNRFYPIEGLL